MAKKKKSRKKQIPIATCIELEAAKTPLRVVTRVLTEAEMKASERIVRRAVRNTTRGLCKHKRTNGTSNIKWMEHSNNIIKGVCGQCYKEFDTRNPADLVLLRLDSRSIETMARVLPVAPSMFHSISSPALGSDFDVRTTPTYPAREVPMTVYPIERLPWYVRVGDYIFRFLNKIFGV